MSRGAAKESAATLWLTSGQPQTTASSRRRNSFAAPRLQWEVIRSAPFGMRAVEVCKTKNSDEPCGSSESFVNPGNDLVSHAVARAVPSALRGLTSVFGMGTGVTLSVRSPENFKNLERSL